MRRRSRIQWVWMLCTLFVILTTMPAYAYIDPNAAGLLSQILTPLLVAAAAGAAFFRKQIARLFDGISHRFRRRTDV